MGVKTQLPAGMASMHTQPTVVMYMYMYIHPKLTYTHQKFKFVV